MERNERISFINMMEAANIGHYRIDASKINWDVVKPLIAEAEAMIADNQKLTDIHVLALATEYCGEDQKTKRTYPISKYGEQRTARCEQLIEMLNSEYAKVFKCEQCGKRKSFLQIHSFIFKEGIYICDNDNCLDRVMDCMYCGMY